MIRSNEKFKSHEKEENYVIYKLLREVNEHKSHKRVFYCLSTIGIHRDSLIEKDDYDFFLKTIKKYNIEDNYVALKAVLLIVPIQSNTDFSIEEVTFTEYEDLKLDSWDSIQKTLEDNYDFFDLFELDSDYEDIEKVFYIIFTRATFEEQYKQKLLKML